MSLVSPVFNRPPAFGSQMSGGKKDLTVPGRRKALQEKPISVPAAAPVECSAEVRECTTF